jgi:hypothetical protein
MTTKQKLVKPKKPIEFSEFLRNCSRELHSALLLKGGSGLENELYFVLSAYKGRLDSVEKWETYEKSLKKKKKKPKSKKG